jgi:hypothetical protein
MLSRSLYVIALTLWFRADRSAIWIALPLLIAVLFEELPRVGDFFKRRYGKPFGWLLTFTVAVFYWTLQRLGSYTKLLEYLNNLREVSGSYQSLYTYATSIGSDIIIVTVVALVILLPLSHTGKSLLQPATGKKSAVLEVAVMILLMALLLLTIVYFIPQFPQYAIDPYKYFII